MSTYVKGPEYSKESLPDMAPQSPEAEGLLLARALAGALGVELAIAVVELAGGELSGPLRPR